MISTEHWPSPFDNTPELDNLPWDAEDQRLAMAAGTDLVIADPGIVPAEAETP